MTLDAPVRFGIVTLPRRSPRASIAIEQNATVRTVQANGRVVLYDPEGLAGNFDVDLSRYETTTLRFDGVQTAGDVSVAYYPRHTRKPLVEVTVDA